VVLSGLAAEEADELGRLLGDLADVTVVPLGDLAGLSEAEACGVVVLGPGVPDPSGVATTLLGRHRSLAVVIAAPAGEVAPVAERVLLGPALDWSTAGRPADLEAAVRGLADRSPTGTVPTRRLSGPSGAVVAAMTEALAGGLERPLHDRLGDAARLLAAHLGVPAGVWMPGQDGLGLVVAAACPGASSAAEEETSLRLRPCHSAGWWTPHPPRRRRPYDGTVSCWPSRSSSTDAPEPSSASSSSTPRGLTSRRASPSWREIWAEVCGASCATAVPSCGPMPGSG
jgi:hypothetical protein